MKGVVSHTNRGALYFAAWSMDVKVEGENVVRNLDIGTHNHASQPGNSPPWPFLAGMSAAMQTSAECQETVEKVKDDCKTSKAPDKRTKKCAAAQKCVLAPKSQDKKICCKPETTGHHLVEVHCLSITGARGTALRASRSIRIKSWPGAGAKMAGGGRADAISNWYYGQARSAGVKAHSIANPMCDPKCTEKQLDEYHNACGIDDKTPVRTDPMAGTRTLDECLAPEVRDGLNAECDAIQGVGSQSAGDVC